MPDTLHPPTSVIATWPKPNYIDPHTRGPALANLCVASCIVGVIVVSARLYTRLFITRAAGLDDALIVIALIFGIALSALVMIGNHHWWSGHHIWDIPITKFAGHRLNIWNAEWCYVIATSATKISVLLFYRRISIKFSRGFIIATWAGIIFNIFYMIAFCMVLLLLCSPINAYWNSFNPIWVLMHPGQHCGKENIELPLSGVFSVIGDFYSALLPILIIVNLNLTRRQKLSLYALFSLAFLIVAAGIARTILMWQMMNEDYDFTWVLWEMWIWGIVELWVAVLAASAPALKPFIRQMIVDPVKSVAAATASRRRPTIIKKPEKSLVRSKAGLKSNHSFYKSHQSSTKSRLSVRESALMDDLEAVGVAWGGKDALTSWDEFIGHEIENDELDTRQFKLSHDRCGKVAIAQVWTSRPTSSKSMKSMKSDAARSWKSTALSSHRPATYNDPSDCTPPPAYTGAGDQDMYVRNYSLPSYSSYTAPSTPTKARVPDKRNTWHSPPARPAPIRSPPSRPASIRPARPERMSSLSAIHHSNSV